MPKTTKPITKPTTKPMTKSALPILDFVARNYMNCNSRATRDALYA